MAEDFAGLLRQLGTAEHVSGKVLAEIERELEHCPSADLWILQGDAIQLSDGRDYDLEDAASYRKAMEVDPVSADAYESLAFILAVRANPRESLPLFRRAIELGAGTSAREG